MSKMLSAVLAVGVCCAFGWNCCAQDRPADVVVAQEPGADNQPSLSDEVLIPEPVDPVVPIAEGTSTPQMVVGNGCSGCGQANPIYFSGGTGGCPGVHNCVNLAPCNNCGCVPNRSSRLRSNRCRVSNCCSSPCVNHKGCGGAVSATVPVATLDCDCQGQMGEIVSETTSNSNAVSNSVSAPAIMASCDPCSRSRRLFGRGLRNR